MNENQQHSGTIWERLRRNRDENTHLFTEAHIRPELAGKVICPACGAEESVLFWSVVRRRNKQLYMLCPICEEAQIRFSLLSNRAVDLVFTRGSVGGGMGMVVVLATVGVLVYFRDTPPMQMLAEKLMATRAAVAEGSHETRSRIGTTGSSSPGGSGGGAASRPATPQPSPRPSSGPQSGGAGGSRPAAAGLAAEPANGTAEPDAAAARTSGALVYRSRGDRREDLDQYAAWIIERRNEAEYRLLLDVRYDPQRDETLVVVDSTSYEWPRRLTWLRGWRRLNE
jgi:hypothetical protein